MRPDRRGLLLAYVFLAIGLPWLSIIGWLNVVVGGVTVLVAYRG